MKAPASKARARERARKQKQAAPLSRGTATGSLRTWVIPTVTIATGLTAFLLYNLGLLEQAPAVIAVGAAALVLILFVGLRGFAEGRVSRQLLTILAAFVGLWSATTFYPFYRAVEPGPPVFSTELSRNGSPVVLPLAGKPGRYTLVVEGHFLPVEGRQNRTATYHIALGHDGVTDRVLGGSFQQEWGTQRVGSGRRSSLVPILHETSEVLDTIDAPEGRKLTLKLTDLSPGVRDSVTLRLYSEGAARMFLIGLGVLTLAGAVVLDAWRPKGTSEGLMATLTTATLLSIVIFRASSAAEPGFPQLVVAVLIGTLGGAIAGMVLWRVAHPIRRYLPAKP